MRGIAAFLAAVLLGTAAHAAVLGAQIKIVSPPSTSVGCTIGYPVGTSSFVSPVPSGTVVCPLVVSPPSWTGTITLSGANAPTFAVVGGNLTFGTTFTLPGGSGGVTLHVTVTAKP